MSDIVELMQERAETYSGLRQSSLTAIALDRGAETILALRKDVEGMRSALSGLLARDVRNACQHENTHRGGAIWVICDDCGVKWADDEGGKPDWQDPPEWVAARAALATEAE